MSKQSIRVLGFLLLLSAFFMVLSFTGQAQNSISGVINSYTRVTSVDGTDQVTVNDPSLFAVGDTVLIIQMKGVEISVDNTSSFGLKQTSFSAGYYEFLIIFDITGNQVTFDADMSHSYDVVGEVQLIRAPGFDNAAVTGTLTCDPWDPVSGTGGVVAMIVGNTLTLEADIDVSGKGFLGGASVVRPSGTCGVGDYFFNDASTEGGYKGEGIATYGFEIGGLPLGTDYIKGRGRYFNGGGGGNGLYSGGGGGGNGGNGGHGGKEKEEIACGALIWGEGGYKIPGNINYEGDRRIYMGGGGGAGTQLFAGEGTDGGNGGGIVIIVADTLVGNSNSIIANGESVTGVATGNAGSGGGGAGGSILLEVSGYKGSNLNLEAKGGNGGAVTGTPTCSGPGGGGGGGIIWHSGTNLPGEVSTSVLPGVAVPGSCASMLAESGFSGEVTNDLVVTLTGFLFNSIYSSRTGMLLDTICENEIPPRMLGTQPKGGTLPYTYVWESSEDKTNWSSVAGGPTPTYYDPPDPLIDTTYYRRRVLDNSVPQIVDESKILTIIVQPKIENYDITTDDTICYNQVPLLITSDALGPPTGGDGTGIFTYYWEDSIAGGTWNEIPGAEDETYQPPNLTETTYYRRIVQSGIGCPKTSNVSNVVVLPLITNNDIITADQIICEGFEFNPLDAEGYPVLNGGNTAAGDYRFLWEESTDGSTWSGAYGPNANEDYAPDTTSSTFPSTTAVQFRRIVLSGPADVCKDTSNVVTMTQWPKITNNVAPYYLEYCEGEDPDPIDGSTPAGGNSVEYLFKWEKYEGSWNEISGETSDDYDPGVLTDSLFYRRIVTSDVCKDTSIVDTIPVNPALQNFNIQTLSGGVDTTVCFGATPNRLIPESTPITGGDGTYVYSWDKSEDGGTNWTSAGGTLEYFDPPALNDNTVYRRNVSSNVCTEVSIEITINVLPSIADNTFTSDGSVCSNLPITLTGSDPTGGAGSYTYLWEESPDDATWNPASGTNDQKDYTSPQLTTAIYYRRTVYSGLSDCCQDISASELISINPLPTATLTDIDVAICDGESQDLIFTLTGASNWDLTYTDGVSDFTINNISSNAHNEPVIPPATGEYTDYSYIIVDLVDGNGCVAVGGLSGNAKIHVDGIPTPNAGADADVCGLTYTLQASTDFGSGSWTFPTAVVDAADNTNPNKEVTVDTYGTHNFIWTVINGVCTPEQDDVDITFFEPPSPADAGQDTILVPLTTEINLYGNTPLVGTGEWTNNPVDAQAIIADPSNPATLVTNLAAGENKFVWTISNGPCPVESDEVIVDLFAFKIPNGFSPNGDAINDFFVISGILDYENELIILSRQGTEVFRATNYQNGWDGKYSSGDDVPDDTYYYILYYTKDGKRYQHSGWLIIKR